MSNAFTPTPFVNFATPFDELPLASFTPDGGSIIYIPIEEAEKDGSGRDKVHKFPHSPGGLPELLGVELYVVTIKAQFDIDFEQLYPGNYPDAINTLELAFEMQMRGALMLPTFTRPMRVYCTNWKRTFKSRLRSGEMVALTFRQDETITQKFSQARAFNIGSDNSTLQALTSDETDPNAVSLLASINSLVNDIEGLQDGLQADSMLLAAKVDRLSLVCNNLNSTFADLDQPANWQITDALHDVWYSAIQLRNDVQNTGNTLQFYVVPYMMTIAQLSIAIFGDSTHVEDIEALNNIDDEYNIPAPTKIAYYDPNATG